MIKKSLLISSIAGMLFGASAWADQKSEMTMTKQEADKVLSSGGFKPVKSKAEIPQTWYKSMDLQDISDIGGPFSADCTGDEPHCRMITGALSDNYAVVILEHGGFAYFRTFKLYRDSKNKVQCVYSEDVDQKRLDDIQKKIAK